MTGDGGSVLESSRTHDLGPLHDLLDGDIKRIEERGRRQDERVGGLVAGGGDAMVSHDTPG